MGIPEQAANRGIGRPFYEEFAWAFDALIAHPVTKQCAFIVDHLTRRAVLPRAALLDAGCGTGNYALELARAGYSVTGVDAASALIAEADRKAAATALPVNFQVGNLLSLSSLTLFDGVLCRGVLNDLTEDSSREGAFGTFARVLRKNGVLIFDVREWSRTVDRKTKTPIFERSVQTPRGRLTFRSVTTLDFATRQLRIAEQHQLHSDGCDDVWDYHFVMRCWTIDEVRHHLDAAGFGSIEYWGSYDHDIPIGVSDRIVAIARRN